MNTPVEDFAKEASVLGRQNYARWDDALFDQVCQTSARYLWTQSKQDNVLLENYIRVLSEALGHGYVTQAASPEYRDVYVKHTKWRCLLEYWLILEAPIQLSALPTGQRLAVLAKVWNVGENSLRGPSWMDPFLLKKALQSPVPLADVETHLSLWLGPLLAPKAASAWEPPFEVHTLNSREIDNDFLPGEMHMSAPAVVCVADRRLPNVFGGVFLHEQPCTLLGHHSDLGRCEMPPINMEISFDGEGVQIGKNRVLLPFINELHSYLICPSGVIFATAVDSQKLWIVRSAS
jgi:hypothetical protein